MGNVDRRGGSDPGDVRLPQLRIHARARASRREKHHSNFLRGLCHQDFCPCLSRKNSGSLKYLLRVRCRQRSESSMEEEKGRWWTQGSTIAHLRKLCAVYRASSQFLSSPRTLRCTPGRYAEPRERRAQSSVAWWYSNPNLSGRSLPERRWSKRRPAYRSCAGTGSRCRPCRLWWRTEWLAPRQSAASRCGLRPERKPPSPPAPRARHWAIPPADKRRRRCCRPLEVESGRRWA